MRSFTPFVFLFAIGALPMTASAQDDQRPKVEKKKDATDKKVCRRVSTTGSIMQSRVCHTKAEWATIDGQNANDAQNALDQRRTGIAR